MYCNTSINQYVLMNILDTTATQPLNFNRHGSADAPLEAFFDTSKPLNAGTVWELWTYVSRKLLEVFASATVPGLFQSVVLQNNLTNFAVEVDGASSRRGVTDLRFVSGRLFEYSCGGLLDTVPQIYEGG